MGEVVNFPGGAHQAPLLEYERIDLSDVAFRQMLASVLIGRLRGTWRKAEREWTELGAVEADTLEALGDDIVKLHHLAYGRRSHGESSTT